MVKEIDGKKHPLFFQVNMSFETPGQPACGSTCAHAIRSCRCLHVIDAAPCAAQRGHGQSAGIPAAHLPLCCYPPGGGRHRKGAEAAEADGKRLMMSFSPDCRRETLFCLCAVLFCCFRAWPLPSRCSFLDMGEMKEVKYLRFKGVRSIIIMKFSAAGRR